MAAVVPYDFQAFFLGREIGRRNIFRYLGCFEEPLIRYRMEAFFRSAMVPQPYVMETTGFAVLFPWYIQLLLSLGYFMLLRGGILCSEVPACREGSVQSGYHYK